MTAPKNVGRARRTPHGKKMGHPAPLPRDSANDRVAKPVAKHASRFVAEAVAKPDAKSVDDGTPVAVAFVPPGLGAKERDAVELASGSAGFRVHSTSDVEEARRVARLRGATLFVHSIATLAKPGDWREALRHAAVIAADGIHLQSVGEPWFDGAAEFLPAIAAWIADQERVKRSARSRAAAEDARRRGRRLGRPRVAIDEDEMRRMRGRGLSWEQIARRFGVGRTTVIRAHRRDPPRSS